MITNLFQLSKFKFCLLALACVMSIDFTSPAVQLLVHVILHGIFLILMMLHVHTIDVCPAVQRDKRQRRKDQSQGGRPASVFICSCCRKDCHPRIGLSSHTWQCTRTTIQSTTPQSLRLMDALYTTDKDEFQTEMYILSA